MVHTALDLKFGPGPIAGFTRVSVAGFSDLRPAAIIRELIQNSLDAANKAGERKAIVHFRLTSGKIKDIPGIQNYQKALASAIETQKRMCGGELPDNVKNIVHTISAALGKNAHDILSVWDNGIGLNELRMDALLGDGVSANVEHDAAGTYGNGHSVVIPASDLRYILYGGVTQNGSRCNKIGSGHAVLASHTARQKGRPYLGCGDGFLIHKFLSGEGGKVYEYARGKSIPSLIAKELSDIRKRFGHGTSVIIPAFNNFREELPLWELVSSAAAANFFQAIASDRLIIRVEDLRSDREMQLDELNRTTLSETLEKHRDELRTSSFISGRRAFEAYETYRRGETGAIKTDSGTINVVIRSNLVEKTGIDLCRNGMWITNNLPRFYGKFTDREPFHALLLLDSSVGDRLYKLMRSAESPLHDKLNQKYLQRSEDRRDFRNALDDIVAWLRGKVPEIDSESYTPDDFLLNLGIDDADAGGTSRKSIWGTPTAVSSWAANPHLPKVEGVGPPTVPSGGGGGGLPPVSISPKIRPKLRPIFQATSTLVKASRRLIHLEFQKDCKNAQLRLYVDGNIDATCDGPSAEEIIPVTLGKCVKVDGRQIQPAELVREDGRAVGILLGDVGSGGSHPIVVEVEYELPEHFSVFKKQIPALRIEVFRTPEKFKREFK